MSMLALMMAAAVTAAPREITAAGPKGALAGTLIEATRGAPVVLIIPGSGPTDRDGNNPLGVNAGSYRLLAEGLAARGVSSVRIDKRGMFGSKAAVDDANAVTIGDYAGDVRGWVRKVRATTGARCVWLLGHSEGALVALTAAQVPAEICGVVSIAGPGRKLGAVMREQLRANPANAPILTPALAMVDSLEAGRRVDPASLPAPLPQLFPASVQGYLIDLLKRDPALLAGSLKVPLIIVQGDRDLQVSMIDARALAAGQPKARVQLVAGMNHVLKSAPEDRAANMATYRNSALPLAPGLLDVVAGAVSAPGRTGRRAQ